MYRFTGEFAETNFFNFWANAAVLTHNIATLSWHFYFARRTRTAAIDANLVEILSFGDHINI